MHLHLLQLRVSRSLNCVSPTLGTPWRVGPSEYGQKETDVGGVCRNQEALRQRYRKKSLRIALNCCVERQKLKNLLFCLGDGADFFSLAEL